eukprot:Amastigsp_a176607_61.p4 type:complete len:125 gc:universal Amastigsp_a176607_61:885-1259(+)
MTRSSRRRVSTGTSRSRKRNSSRFAKIVLPALVVRFTRTQRKSPDFCQNIITFINGVPSSTTQTRFFWRMSVWVSMSTSTMRAGDCPISGTHAARMGADGDIEKKPMSLMTIFLGFLRSSAAMS